MKIHILVISFLCISVFVKGQSSTIETAKFQNVLKASELLGKAPAVAEMEKFGMYEVDLSKGLPVISIPIYTIQSGDLVYPISLSYNLSGIKVAELAGWVGLGWSLNVGGSISRIVKGLPDEDTSGLLSNFKMELIQNDNSKKTYTVPLNKNEYNQITGKGDGYNRMIDYLTGIKNNNYDGMSDIYNYSAGDISGKFVYNLNREIENLPFSDNKITRNSDNTYKIISDNGTIYEFGQNSTFNKYSAQDGSKMHGREYISAWLLTSIKSQTNSIKFNYYPEKTYEEQVRSAVERFEYKPAQQTKIIHTLYKAKSSERLLSSIEFDGGSIEFVIKSDRVDIREDYLYKLIVKNDSNETIKEVVFNYGYFDSTNPEKGKIGRRLKLKDIKVFDQKGIHHSMHSFTYDESLKFPPYVSSNNSENKGYYGQDLWGYYNGVTTNLHLIPYSHKCVNGKPQILADRTSNESYMKACVLKEIHYPTGGSTRFDVESNRDSEGNIVGGLRVAKIVSKSEITSDSIVKSYKYEWAEKVYKNDVYSYGTINRSKENSDEIYYYEVISLESPFRLYDFYSGPPVIYAKVIETIAGGDSGKTIYYFDGIRYSVSSDPVQFLDFSNPPYTKAILPFMFETPADNKNIPYRMYQFISETPQMWHSGHLIKKEHYKKDNYVPVKISSYEYETYLADQVPVGMCAYDLYIDHVGGLKNPDILNAKANYQPFFVYGQSGYKKVSKITESDYDESTKKYIVSETFYKYDNIKSTYPGKNCFITEKHFVDSKGKARIEKFKYPQDNNDEYIYKQMVSKNMLSLIIEQSNYVDGNETGKKNISYRYVSNRILPKDIKTTNQGITRTDVTYEKYDDRGNIQQYTTYDGVTTVLLWSYNYNYPVAEIKNATYDQVKTALGDISIEDFFESSIPDEKVLDDLHTNPELRSAFVTTYTYYPLIGMKSMKTPDGIKMYYEYDRFLRLRNMRDRHGNILETYNYHYKN